MQSRPALFLPLLLAALNLSAAELKVDPKDLPRIPATEPAEALKTFQVKPGFHLELAAHEPLVVDPITMCFDEHGRLFVIEMIDYSERREETPHPGRVRMLVDTNFDGTFDRSTVYADNLPWPTALVCYGGGVFVGATPDILWLKDTNGDGRAEERKVVFTGFASGTSRLNVQALFNSFQWGLDNRIHGTASTIGGNAVRRPGDPDAKAVNLSRLDFSFDPRTLDLRAETGGGQYGMSFDTLGRKFTCSNSDHAQAVMYELAQAGRNPRAALPPARVGIAADGPAAEVFRLSPDEPWRILRTRWRVSGVLPKRMEGGGRVSGYFTGATGLTVYRGHAYPDAFRDNLFVGDAGGNLVHRKVVAADGAGFVARRPADEQKLEFVASRDNWFRPVHFANAPDGCLYIADMYRETIEHPWSIPEEIKRHLDLNSGNNRGRIYRLAPDGFKFPGELKLAYYPTPLLVDTLRHANGWHRETAARLLFERRDPRAVPLLAANAAGAREAFGRLHSLWALQGLGALESHHVLGALGDRDERVREQGVKLAAPFAVERRPSPALLAKLFALARDPHPRVRYQLAFTLAGVQSPGRVAALADIARRDAGDRWVRAALLNALASGAGELFGELARDIRFLLEPDSRVLLAELARVIGARGDVLEVKEVLDYLGRVTELATVTPVLGALNEGLRRVGKRPMDFDAKGRLAPLKTKATQVLATPGQPAGEQSAALQILATEGWSQTGPAILAALDANLPPGVRQAALKVLVAFPDAAVTTEILNRWKKLDGAMRQAVLAAFLPNRARALALLDLVADGRIRPDEVAAYQVQALRDHKDQAIAARAKGIFGESATANLAQVLRQYQPALATKGDAAKGAVIFRERCASCHRANGEGHALGPDLVTVKTTGREKLLLNLVNPNVEVAPQYLAFTVETADDESLTGVIAQETTTHLTLRQANGIEKTLPRAQVRSMDSTGKSLMPDELHKDLSVQQMADLLDFIEQAK